MFKSLLQADEIRLEGLEEVADQRSTGLPGVGCISPDIEGEDTKIRTIARGNTLGSEGGCNQGGEQGFHGRSDGWGAPTIGSR